MHDEEIDELKIEATILPKSPENTHLSEMTG